MPPGPRVPQQQRPLEKPFIASHVQTVGVRRPNWGHGGRPITVATNHFEVRVPDSIIHHYDIVISPPDKTLPAKLNFDIIDELQKASPQIFKPKAVYDGRKNMFAIRALPLSGSDNRGQAYEEFSVDLPDENPKGKGRTFTVRITKVAEINPEVLHGFLAGRQSHDNAVLTTITAMNVVIRMLPMAKYPFNVRSFFSDREKKDIGGGLILWRGYFQSIRPGGNKMWINIDISTGTMYKDIALVPLCMEHLNYNRVEQLTRNGGFNERERMKLQRFIAGVRVTTSYSQNARVIKKITLDSAGNMFFQTREGNKMSVQQYFEQTYRQRLSYPNLPCVEVGSGALIPIELCTVVPGQLMRKQVPPEKTRDVLLFSTLKPQDRLVSIKNALNVFQYQNSEYMRAFKMDVNTSAPLTVPARVLAPPTLIYGPGSRVKQIKPDNGAWNMREKFFYKPGELKSGWMVACFERPNRFSERDAQGVVNALRRAAKDVGLIGFDAEPLISVSQDPRKSPIEFLQEMGGKYAASAGKHPGLVVCVLPEGATNIYTAIKHFGDCMVGVATQCMKANKCGRGSPQYFANICLKLNVKLGGINCVPAPQDVPMIADRSQATIVFGADVIHPAPGATGRPSFTSLVGTLDSEQSKYVARVAVQESRVEMIADLKSMAGEILGSFRSYRAAMERVTTPPRRVIFYRDGVSEGQFQQVLDSEVPRLKDAFRALGVPDQQLPKFTVIVVGKRHHVRFFPMKFDRDQSDQSGNCKAGTVVDRDITHPVELDFYLQSHAGLLGTSRPAHYNVLLDENGFSPDAIQQLSFALCHVYARSTRSVSIPAPVYYADIVCSRARNHFDPRGTIDVDTTHSPEGVSRPPTITAFKNAFLPVKGAHAASMYFS